MSESEHRCAKCGAVLTTEERLLHDIFGTCHIDDEEDA